ncbi:MAG: hypothetical protein KA132_11325 [Thauera sp.]|nr:hypothetical protein [Thauera sp.]
MKDTRTPQEILRDARAALNELNRQLDALSERGMLTMSERAIGLRESLHRRLETLEVQCARWQK